MTPLFHQSEQGIGGAVNALTPLGTCIEPPLGTPGARLPCGRLPETLSRRAALLSTVELRELRYFAAAARAGNLGQAARDLNVTAPAISQQLRKLEDELGTQLLVRHSRGVTPTLAGACLLERIDSILHLLDTPLDPEAAGAAIGGMVSLAVPAEIGTLLAAPLMEQLIRHWPGVTLDIQESNGGTEARMLGGLVDIAVLQDPPDLDGLRIDPLLTEGLGLVAPPGAALAGSSLPVRLRDLAGVKLILPNPRHCLRRALTRTAFQRGVRLDVAVQMDSVAMTKEMVRNGLGCTVLPAVAVREELARGSLVFRALAQPAVSAARAMASRHGAPPVVRDIARMTGDVIRCLTSTGAWPGAQLARSPGPGKPPAQAPNPAQDTPPAAWRLPVPESVRGSLELAEGD
jgi:LysR family transcriptional regulator, nitrogen assimilation regulatory protein